MTGKIVPSNATSATIRRIPSFRSYQVIVVAVDASGRPFNSSAVYVRTLEGGDITSFNLLEKTLFGLFILRRFQSASIKSVGIIGQFRILTVGLDLT